MQLNWNIEDLHFDAALPALYRVRRVDAAPAVPDIAQAVAAQLDAIRLADRLRPGMTVAVTAGSRGIHDIVPALRASVAYLAAHGARPFLVPAMGSHGGATASGQIGMLAELGVTEETIGCPIESSMDVVELGRLPGGVPALLDRHAAEADGILVVNRVKPHTDFHGTVESGLSKMIAIGLGKRRGAETLHSYGPDGLREFVPAIARMVVASGHVLGGLALLEDATERTAEIVALPAEEIGAAGEAALLLRATRLLGRLPFSELDVLVVDQIGKNISGAGMDTNVLNRMRVPGDREPDGLRIRIIVALDLTPQSHGNAAGVGLADIISARLARKIDIAATYINGLTAGRSGVQRVSLPVVLPDDRSAIAAALHCCSQPVTEAVRLARISSTLALQELLISRPLLAEAEAAGYVLQGPAGWDDLDGPRPA